MEKLRGINAGRLLNRLAVPSEPGLTNAELMLTNYDLKPGKAHRERELDLAKLIESTVEKERRQWGPWNFVGFWIADSFNIVRLRQS